MFITCQECNTTFRLDEALLKPTGSKVRCSQCRHMFLAYPPSPQPSDPIYRDVAAPAVPLNESPPPAPPVEEEEQELEGIDLAELDSILEQGAPRSAGLEEELAQELESGDAGDDVPELDDADLDLDFDAALDLDSDDGADDTLLAEQGDEEDLDLEMDFSLDDGLPPVPPVSQEEEQATEGLEDALSLEEDLEAAAEAAKEDAPLEDGDLDLDLDGLDTGKEEATPALEPAAASGDDLDLGDLDFDLDGDVDEKVMGAEEPELSLADESDELDLKLDEPGGPDVEASATAEADATGSDELDLDLDLGDELEMDMEAAPETSPEDTEEPELSLEFDASAEPAGDDLDLGDLDALLETGGEGIEAEADEPAVKPDESEDLELKLDLGDEHAEAPAVDSGEGDELEDLEFELDSEFTDGPASEVAPDEAAPIGARAGDTIAEDDEIDLSDIEEMLESGQVADVAAKPSEAPEEDLDLGLGGDSDEIDLSEIESAIESADEADAARDLEEEADEPELELDLELDDTSQPADEPASEGLEISLDDESAGADDDLDLDLDLELESEAPSDKAEPADEELDLSDLSELVEESEKKTERIDNGDIELEFEIEEGEEEPAAAVEDVNRTAGSTQEFTVDQALAETPFVDEKPEKPAKKKPPKQKKKTSKTLLVLFFLILLGGIGYGAYYAVTQLGIEIPYLSEYLKPKPQDPAGTINLSTMEINSKFLENNLAGRLFVITGKVRNGYGTNREKIRLQGKLFTKGKVLVKTEYSYAGIILNDQDLATLPIAQIKQRLNTVPQGQAGDTIVKPGQTLPFMVVFSELPPPEQLDEFAIELLSSVQGR